MKTKELIISLEQSKNYNYHFTDYEFNEFEENFIVSETRRNWLVKEYFKFIDDLRYIINEYKDSNSIEKSIKKLVENIVAENYLRIEYKLMLYKINEVVYFNLGNELVIEYYTENESKQKCYR
jgi:hypothetical protein